MSVTDKALREMSPEKLVAVAMDTTPFVLAGSTARSRAAREILRRLAATGKGENDG